MHLWNLVHAARWKYRTQKWLKKSPSGHHRTNLSGYIFATKARIDNRKNLLSSDMCCTCPHNMVNFGLLTAEICWRVWGTLQISTGFASWQLEPHALSLPFLANMMCDGTQMAYFWRFFVSCISASRVHQVSEMHSKFALRPHHVRKYGRHPIYDGWE